MIDGDVCAPHFFVIDPRYKDIQPFHTNAINKLNVWIQMDRAKASNIRIINHTMVNLSYDFVFDPRDYGAIVCYYMWMIYKLVVSYTLTFGGNIDARHDNLKK